MLNQVDFKLPLDKYGGDSKKTCNLTFLQSKPTMIYFMSLQLKELDI